MGTLVYFPHDHVRFNVGLLCGILLCMTGGESLLSRNLVLEEEEEECELSSTILSHRVLDGELAMDVLFLWILATAGDFGGDGGLLLLLLLLLVLLRVFGDGDDLLLLFLCILSGDDDNNVPLLTLSE